MSHLGTFESLSSLSRSLPPLLAPQQSWEPRNPSSSALGWSRRRGTECCLVTLRRHLQLIFRSTQPCTPAVCCRSPLCSPVVWSPRSTWRSWRTGTSATGRRSTAWTSWSTWRVSAAPGAAQGRGDALNTQAGPRTAMGLRVRANCYAQWQNVPRGEILDHDSYLEKPNFMFKEFHWAQA